MVPPWAGRHPWMVDGEGEIGALADKQSSDSLRLVRYELL